MVKAGVFLLIKLAPIMMACPVPSVMVILVGGLTFLFCSFMAISQSNAKRVLAYSTIANLGLIVACAGVGTPEAVWAAAFLVLFHAIEVVAVPVRGTAEHHIGSRDIEDMDLLFAACRVSPLHDAGYPVHVHRPVRHAAGRGPRSSPLRYRAVAPSCFWRSAPRPRSCSGRSGWALSGIAARPENVEAKVHSSEWVAIMVMAAVILCCIDRPSSRGLWWNRTSTACTARSARTSRPRTCGSPRYSPHSS
ncbi:MAG: proton-conducting transporter membrane subunit [Eggerthellaceae bacterium]